MFAGFPSTNTPAIQVWDFYNDVASTARNSVYLTDDCAPIQFFKTGNNFAVEILVYLPASPIEGKTITIVNQRFGSGLVRYLYIKTSDRSGDGSAGNSFILGTGGMLTLVYSKQVISYGTATGIYQSGWIALNQGSGSAANAYGVALGGLASTANGSYTAVIGGSSNSAGGQYSAILGGTSNTADGTRAAVVGGASNNASNSSAIVLGGQLNAAGGVEAGIVAGSSNTANGSDAFIGGGTSNSASNSYSSVLAGTTNTASGAAAVVVGGANSLASSLYSSVIGGRYGSTRSITGNVVFAASSSPVGAAFGNQQAGLLILGVQTTDATVTTLRSDTNLAGTDNQVILPNNSAYYFRGSVIANVTGGGNTKAWTFEGAIKRGATAASTTIVQSVINPVASNTGAEAWAIAIAADTTNGGLQVTVTGQASTTIRWVCKVETTEVTF